MFNLLWVLWLILIIAIICMRLNIRKRYLKGAIYNEDISEQRDLRKSELYYLFSCMIVINLLMGFGYKYLYTMVRGFNGYTLVLLFLAATFVAKLFYTIGQTGIEHVLEFNITDKRYLQSIGMDILLFLTIYHAGSYVFVAEGWLWVVMLFLNFYFLDLMLALRIKKLDLGKNESSFIKKGIVLNFMVYFAIFLIFFLLFLSLYAVN